MLPYCPRRLLLASALFLPSLAALSQGGTNTPPDPGDYHLRIPVDEVVLTFFASDPHGLPVNDLKLSELQIRDNGQPPRKVLAFDALDHSALHAGFLLDTSPSVENALSATRSTALQAAQYLLRKPSDQVFLMDFGYTSNIELPWTNDPNLLAAHIRSVEAGARNPLGGTSLFDTIFRACFDLFGKLDPSAGSNSLLLFSDGEDTASHVSLEQAADACQRSNTTIYPFRAGSAHDFPSTGPQDLAELAAQTGGEVFRVDDPQATLERSLQIIETRQHNHYRLIYKPGVLNPDASFHRVELIPVGRDLLFVVRSGYYAPTR
jgi:Ca-activated chloride channel family protein